MGDGEVEFSNQELLSSSSFGEFPECSSYMEGLFNEIFTDMYACVHTHTCNPPGPDNPHTHTCYHVHTKIVPPPNEDKILSDDTAGSGEKVGKKRPLSNKEAVRKYREKKKAQAESLEHEVVRLRAMNQQLLKRLRDQAVLEAEVARLKCLLVDIRGRIEGEIGSFPYKKPMESGDVYQNLVNPILPGTSVINPCNLQCDDQVYCLHPCPGELNGRGGFNGCGVETLPCLGDQGLKAVPGCALSYATPTSDDSCKNQGKGGKHAMAS